MIKKFLIVILTLQLGCKSKSIKKTTLDSSHRIIQISTNSHGEETVWTSYFTEDSIPKFLLNRLTEVNPTIFQNRDSLKSIFKDNSRQFAFVARAGYLWDISYKHVDTSTHYHLIIFTIVDDKVKDVRVLVSSEKLESIDQVKKAVLNRKMQTRNLKSLTEADTF